MLLQLRLLLLLLLLLLLRIYIMLSRNLKKFLCKNIIERTTYEASIGFLLIMHHVFVSFRGEDTRKTFVSHLLSSFKTSCITSFIASEPLEATDHEAMKKSLVAVPVITKSYSVSEWMVKDLSRMIECEKIGTLRVVPIFFQINPLDIFSHVKKYAKVQGGNLEMVRKWLNAQVSRKSSFHSSDWYNCLILFICLILFLACEYCFFFSFLVVLMSK